MHSVITLSITDPQDNHPIISYARHFTVAGTIQHTDPLPTDAILTVRLLDADGNTVRHTEQTQKNNQKLYLNHPSLTHYAPHMDENFQNLKEFGFPELLVESLEQPMESLRNATLKCYYTDGCFKSFLVTATDAEHGLILNDGMGFLDENGNPYTVLPRGEYTISVSLTAKNGEHLACAEKPITIGQLEHQALCRFHPDEHKKNMEQWCKSIHCSITKDLLPGYLDAYLGVWYYHMGLLPMYRANDIALYAKASIHMFVYLIDPTSTSYETELAYLQSQ